MTQTNNERITDPSWEQYMNWHTCQYAKALIDKALKIITSKEFPTAELYQQAQELVRDAEGFLHETFR